MKGIEIITTLTPVLFSFMFFRIVLYRYADIYEINTNNWYYRIQSLNQQTQMKNTSIALGEHFDQYIAEQLASGRYRTASELIRESLRMHQERELKILVMRAAIEDGIASGIDESFSFEGLNRELDAELGSWLNIVPLPGPNPIFLKSADSLNVGGGKNPVSNISHVWKARAAVWQLIHHWVESATNYLKVFLASRLEDTWLSTE